MSVRVGVAVAVVVGLVGTARAGSPLDKPAFTASPKELLEAAKTVPAGDWPVVILREDETRTFDTRGAVQRRHRLVFLLRSQAGVDDWGTWSVPWWPFHQDKPVMRARTILPDGSVVDLDPKLITDTPEKTTSATI